MVNSKKDKELFYCENFAKVLITYRQNLIPVLAEIQESMKIVSGAPISDYSSKLNLLNFVYQQLDGINKFLPTYATDDLSSDDDFDLSSIDDEYN